MILSIEAPHEQVADIPVIIACLKKWVAGLPYEHFPTNGNWTGSSLGWVTVVWLTFIISGGDNQSVIRVHDMKGRIACVDTTTASGFISLEPVINFFK